jgi:hypothetical protein
MAEPTITTTDGLDGHEVTEYLGVVSGEAVIGANVVSDIAAGIRDVVGGRSRPTRRRSNRATPKRSMTSRRRRRTSVPTPSSVRPSTTRRWPKACCGSTSRALQ